MLLVIASLGAILGFFWGKQKNLAHFYFGTTGGVVNVYLNGQKINHFAYLRFRDVRR